MKKIILALAACGMAAMFTACGDDSSSEAPKVVSCNIQTQFLGMKMGTCVEAPAGSVDPSECEADGEEGVTATLGNGCPSGSVLKCLQNGTTMYMYGEIFKGMTCDDLEDEFDDDDYDYDF